MRRLIVRIFFWRLCEEIATQILSTNEGVKYATAFLADKTNERFWFYEYLNRVFNYGGA